MGTNGGGELMGTWRGGKEWWGLMKGEGLVLALVAVCEAHCHRHRASRHFVVSSLSLCLRVALSSCPRSVFLLLSRCGGMSSSWHVVGASSWRVLIA